jgi:predicted esterase
VRLLGQPAVKGHEHQENLLLKDEPVRTWYRKACFLSLHGDLGGAIAALKAGLDEGAWYNPGMLETDPDLTAVRKLVDMELIRRECEDRRRLCRVRARPLCLVLSPASTLWEQQTLLVLHCRGGAARRLAERCRALVDEGWTLVVPQSSQPWDSASWCWDDEELACREVRAQLTACRTSRGLELSRMVMAGVSEGAPLAAQVASEAGLPWLCVIPSFPAEYDVTPLAAVPRHTRCVFILGENDPRNSRVHSVIAALEAAGAFVHTRIMKDAEHELPKDFAIYASEALALLELG